jgi:hypothetical protein
VNYELLRPYVASGKEFVLSAHLRTLREGPLVRALEVGPLRPRYYPTEVSAAFSIG